MEEHWSDERFDLAVTGGTVIDVVGGRYLRANVGIREGKIVCVTEQDIRGARQIDAAGYLVSPGFIDFESHVDGDAYAAQCILRQGGTTTLGGIRRLNGKLIRKIAEEGFLINQGFFVSQAFVLRDAVGIKNPYAPASPREIGAMVDLAARFMECGAFGICFPLELAPGVTRKELLAISQVAKDYDRVVSVHLRKDGIEAVAALDEVFEVAARTGAKLNLLELTYMAGMCGAMPAVLDAMEQARHSGIDITGSSQMYPHFTVCIGTGVFDGGWEKGYSGADYSDLLVSSGIHAGERCTQELFFHLRKERPSTLVTAFVGEEAAVRQALEKDFVFISTNAADGPFYPSNGAPEVAGTFPRLLGRYARDLGCISLMEAVRKITILPARRFQLEDRGSIEPGKRADIVIFDEKTILDRADFMDRGRPDEPPLGIHCVVVNGTVALEDGIVRSDVKAGRLLFCGKV